MYRYTVLCVREVVLIVDDYYLLHVVNMSGRKRGGRGRGFGFGGFSLSNAFHRAGQQQESKGWDGKKRKSEE